MPCVVTAGEPSPPAPDVWRVGVATACAAEPSVPCAAPDMRFAAFGIPVKVDVTFLVIAFIGPAGRLADIVAWTAAAFVAVLAHELGHALVARSFGVRGIAITLFALGGVTTYPAVPRLAPRRQFAVSAAGSAVGIALGGAAFLAGRAGLFDDANRVVEIFMSSLVWIGAVFGLFNWLPIRPLDGGQMLTSGLELVTTPSRADGIARAISLVVGAVAAALAFRYLTVFAGFFVILITLMGLRRGTGGVPAQPTRAANRDAGAPGTGSSGAGSSGAGSSGSGPDAGGRPLPPDDDFPI